jgi:ATP-dependent Zn protease
MKAHVEKAIERVLAGIERKKVMTKSDLTRIAYQEAGKAIVNWQSQSGEPILKMLLLSGKAHGLTQFLKKERVFYTTEILLERMAILAGGRASETHFLQEQSEVCRPDLLRMGQIAHNFVTKYGMGQDMLNTTVED